ncbi:hypothetical protein ES332_D02G179300v1 [Gossypium tomentosum]|uniref:Uncharacterized protein n=1 Tax=Gossypium tomentosum TaxID=34277 RepID=A0A5D2LYQ6_GOSTO|nr:hypothetical protein ES332_D02G179300v1 [Gossypium tomentosum]
MANPLVKAFIARSFLVSATTIVSDSPFIIAHKKASLTKLKSGSKCISVSIDIYIEGFSTAYDVSLMDYSWLQDTSDVTSGNISES